MGRKKQIKGVNMLKGLKSWTDTSEGTLTVVGTVLAAILPDFPAEAFYTLIAYIVGRSWVKSRGKG